MMPNIISGSEVVELGVEIEKNGRDFYNALARNSKDEAIIKIFDYLAKEEEKHIQVFKELLEKTKDSKLPQISADEYFTYMNSLASEYVFTRKDKGKDIAKQVTSDKQAVLMGIGFEKDSIVFYEGIKETVPEQGRQAVDELIRQEQKHLSTLLGLKVKLG
ncbi:MAG: ferritin family protein [Candidatus Omnitrophota bacterium]